MQCFILLHITFALLREANFSMTLVKIMDVFRFFFIEIIASALRYDIVYLRKVLIIFCAKIFSDSAVVRGGGMRVFSRVTVAVSQFRVWVFMSST